MKEQENTKKHLRYDQICFLKKVVDAPDEMVMAQFEEQNIKLQYGDFVILPLWKDMGLNKYEAIIRLVQIREGQAEENTNMLIGRLADGRLLNVGNTPIFKVKKDYIEELTLIYNTHDSIEIDDDYKHIGYNINGIKEVGFFIPFKEEVQS